MGLSTALALRDLGWLMLHYLWMGAVIGLLAAWLRRAIPWTSPRQRYGFSLAVLFLLTSMGLALVVWRPTSSGWGWPAGWPEPGVSAMLLKLVPVLPVVWGGVSLALSAVLVAGMIGTWRLRRAATSAPQPLLELMDRLARRGNLARPIPVRICDRIREPILMGIARPLILLPPAVLLSCRLEQLELILLHELAHVRRHDNLILWLQRAVEMLLGFHPVVWMVSRWVTRDREFCCDEFVLKQSNDRRLYAETLITLAGLSQPAASRFLVAFFGRDHVFARIRFILHSEEAVMSRSRVLAQATVLGMTALWGVLALVSPGPEALAEEGSPPAASSLEAAPPVVPIINPRPALAAPVPIPSLPAVPVANQRPAVPVPRSYTEKPQVTLDPPSAIGTQPPPVPPQPVNNVVPPQPVNNVDVPQPPPAGQPRPKRDWGPEQAEGEPDTMGAGDIVTAWASQSPDNQAEWLVCEYRDAVMPAAIVIHETYNPGSVDKVSVFAEDGTETVAWTGLDPTPRTAARGTSIIPIKTKFKIKKIKIFLDSPSVSGWNEIDAVGLRSEEGNVQWAEMITASSTYAQDAQSLQVSISVQEYQRLMALEKEVAQLKQDLERMKKLEAVIEDLRKLLNEPAPNKQPMDLESQ